MPELPESRRTDPPSVALWLTAGKIGRTGVVFFVPLLLARTLSVAQYGSFKQIDLVATLIWPMLVLSLDRSLTNYLPRPTYDAKREASTVYWTVMGVAVAVLGPMLAFPRLPEILFKLHPYFSLNLATMAHALALSLIFVMQRALVATGHGKTAAIAPLLLEVPYVIGLTVVWAMDGSLAACCWVVTAQSLLACVIVSGLLLRRNLLGFSFDREILRRHLAFALPLWVIGLAQVWGSRIDRYIVNSTMSAADFAIYTVGTTGIPVVGVLPVAVRDAAAPLFARYESEGKRDKIARLWKGGSETVLPACILAAAGQAYLAHLLVPLMYTESYERATALFMLNSVMTLLGVFIGLDSVLRAFAAFRFLAALTFGSLLLRIVLGVAVLPFHSLLLQILAQIVVSCLAVAIQLTNTRYRLGVRWRDLLPTQGWISSLLLSAACVGVCLVVEPRLAGRSLLVRTAILGLPWGAASLYALYRLRRGRQLAASVVSAEATS